MSRYEFTVIIEKDEDGYFAYCPEMQGCYTQGETYEEVIVNIKDAIKLNIEARLSHNEPIKTTGEFTVSRIGISIPIEAAA